jgi:ubiquinone/menaquinone biosynthesis C-methylase UbiE
MNPQSSRWSDRDVAAAYDRFASGYNERAGEEGDFYHRTFTIPSILRFLGEVRGKRVLDMACGTGVFSRFLARKGAVVTGIDISGEMLRFARNREQVEPLGIKYHRSSASNLEKWENESYDAVVCNMAMMDIPDYRGAISEVSRVLVPGGGFVFSMLHPCFCTPDSGWVKRDPNSKKNEDKLFWKVDRYFERASGPRLMQFSMSDTIFFHRTLGDYIGAILELGLRIEAVDEPQVPEDLLPEYADMTRMAEFLVIAARKE